MNVAFDPAFIRAFKRRIGSVPNRKKKFYERLEMFRIDPFNPRLKTHKLMGNLEGLLSFSVDYDVRVIFFLQDEEHAVFVDIGTHDDVY